MNNEPNFVNPTPETPDNTPKTKVCPVCRMEAHADASFCGHCGHNFGAAAAPAAIPSQPVYREDTSPLKTTDYLLMLLVTALPFVSLILMLVWAFSSDVNVNRRNFSRAYLILSLIVSVLYIILLAGLIGLGIAVASSESYAMILPFIFH